jgi:hypothetical protein
LSTTTTKQRAKQRAKCVPIYLAVLTDGGQPAECTYAHTERRHVENYCKGFNDLDAGATAVVKVVRYRLPAVKGGAR